MSLTHVSFVTIMLINKGLNNTGVNTNENRENSEGNENKSI